MPEIRVTRSAGTSWNTKFAPGAQNEPPCGTATTAADITTTLRGVGSASAGGTGTATTNPVSLLELTDVLLSGLNTGDVLRYADNKWRNYNETQLTDGGNF
jgi:hypothetical protein